MDFRVLFGKIVVATVHRADLLVTSPPPIGVTGWTIGDFAQLPLKATLIWLVCIVADAGDIFGHFRPGVVEAADHRSRQRRTGRPELHSSSRPAATSISAAIVHQDAGASRRCPVRHGRLVGNPSPMRLTDMGYRVGASEIVVAADDRRGLPVRQLAALQALRHQGDRFPRFLGTRDPNGRPRGAASRVGCFIRTGSGAALLDEVLEARHSISSSAWDCWSFTLPLLAVTACLIKLESPGPVFYRQKRVGLHGRELHDLQVPQHAGGRRDRWQSSLGGPRRSARDPGGSGHPQTPDRRAGADPQCASRRYELCRAAPGAPVLRRRVGQSPSPTMPSGTG